MIYVFKTSVNTREEVKLLSTDLNELVQHGWNIDLDDCDKVLRIDCNAETSDGVVELLHRRGFDCVELS
ncbi:hypothetical protein DQQ10_06080 [Pseudochryseolinea flava]|uniref:Uncharacterized protein n=1 Tax=Pseudochryseolinea flava TaxID=2059302 RepID=A0A364Y585_9BACT|nr:hypothetical protein DQQ10_06080 [Pseudochryseolinea flava]